MRRFAVALLGIVWLAGCSGSDSPTGPKSRSAAQEASADLRDRFLLDHNASFNGGRTFRWIPPIPIFIGTGEPAVDRFLLEQFTAWERALGGAGGTPFYAPSEMTEQVPQRGIFFAIADLPGRVVGIGNPFVDVGQLTSDGDTVVAQKLRQRAVRAAVKQLEIPEVLASGEIRRCVIVLDESLARASATTLRSVVRHEVGHCLGFIGHVPTGLMRRTCCLLNITSDVRNMMRKLYNLEVGTEVTR